MRSLPSDDDAAGTAPPAMNDPAPPASIRLISDLYVHSSSPKPPLRIGLLLDSPELSRALASVVADIARSNFARIELVIFNGSSSSAAPPAPSSFVRRILRLLSDDKARASAAWTLYSRLDQRLWHVADDPLASEDCASLLDGIETLTVEPLTKGFVHRFPPDAVETIRAANLDVLIRFGFNIIRGDILNAARYGVWSFHHGDNDAYRGGPAHFWELYEGSPLSGVILQVLSDDLDAGRVLAKGMFPTELGLSLIRNRVRPYWTSTHMVIQKLWELHNEGWAFVEKRIVPEAPYRGKRKIYRRPTNSELVKWFAVETARKVYGRVARAVTGAGGAVHWRIAVRSGGKLLPSGDVPEMKGFHWVESPPDRYYADPFVIEREGAHWIFFEDYAYSPGYARIACAEVLAGPSLGPPHLVLDTGVHLSYPHVFSQGDALYMIPESARAGGVRLYRCARFPGEWVQVAELFRGPATDTTVWTHDGLWWFLTTLVDPRGHGTGLFLFYADSLLGTWRYHPANPISLDTRNARCAGRVFESDGRLIRPSQDSTRRYGYAFALNEILKLSPTEYEERQVLWVGPDWYPGLRGNHTYNRAGSIEVIDGQTMRRAPEFSQRTPPR